MNPFKYWLELLTLLLCFTTCMAKEVDREAKFWEWFKANKTRFYEQTEPQENLFDEFSVQLYKVDSSLAFEFSPVHSDGIRELTISADGIREYFPIVKSLVAKAPKLDKWKINAFRQRLPDDYNSIEYGSKIKLSYEDVYFRYAKDSGKIAIELNVRNLIDSPSFKHTIYILLDGLLGEYDMETQISTIEFVLLDEKKIPNLLSLIDLRSIVDKNKQSSIK